ncbi:MAG: hypothetical protein IIW23_04440 [Clostridia bacterium]|nr:hypothetical protein [Clostridia bacterium]
MKKLNGSLWGVALVAVGVLLALKAVDVIAFNLFFDGWWSLFIIVPCKIEFISGEDRLGSVFGVGVGVALLLAAQDIITYKMVWKMAVPAVFILVGIKVILACIFAKKCSNPFRNRFIISTKKNDSPCFLLLMRHSI